MLILADIAALVGFVAAATTAIHLVRNSAFPVKTAFLIGGGGALSIALDVMFSEIGIHSSFDNADEFFSWTHGTNLAIAAATLLVASLLSYKFVPIDLRVGIKIERAPLLKRALSFIYRIHVGASVDRPARARVVIEK